MTIDIKGTVHSIGAKEIKSEKLTIQTMVVKEEGNTTYPNFIPIQFLNDKCSLIANVNANSEVIVSANVNGKEWQGKYFVSLTGWKVNVVGSTPSIPAQSVSNDVPDNLPF